MVPGRCHHTIGMWKTTIKLTANPFELPPNADVSWTGSVLAKVSDVVREPVANRIDGPTNARK